MRQREKPILRWRSGGQAAATDRLILRISSARDWEEKGLLQLWCIETWARVRTTWWNASSRATPREQIIDDRPGFGDAWTSGGGVRRRHGTCCWPSGTGGGGLYRPG